MKALWLWIMPGMCWSPVMVRYFRIQHNTNPFFKEVCSNTKGKILASFLPDVPFKEVFEETLRDCVDKQDVEFVAKHLLTQFISYEINDEFHHILHKVLHDFLEKG